MIEYRDSPPGSIRMDDTKKGQIEITACVYNVVDAFNTRWMPGVFSRSLEVHSPPLCWGHNWNDPIGHLVDHSDTSTNLRMIYQLDDFDDVPRAKQAYSQMNSGTVRDASFGFKLVRDEPDPQNRSVFNQLEARYDETSPVIRGAVPGSRITSVRSVPTGEVLRLARALENGEMPLDEALAAVAAIASEDTRSMHSHAKKEGGGIVNHSHAGADGMHGHTDLMPATRMGRSAQEPYGDVEYADPGYQADKQKRYPVDTEAHAKAAWSYINQEKNASKYSSDDLAKVKAKIAAACKKFGVEISERSAEMWTDEQYRIDGVADDGSKGVGPSKKCPTCGKPTTMQDAKFCPHCGATVAERSANDDIEVREARSLLEEIGL